MPRPKRIRTQRPSYIERKLSKASLKKGRSMRKSKTTAFEISNKTPDLTGGATSSLMTLMSPEMPKSVVKQVNYHWKTLRKHQKT